MNATWYNLSMFHFLWLLPVLLLIFLYGARKKKQALAAFADQVMLKRLTGNISPARRIWKKFFLLCGIFFLILAMARPAWNPVPRDVKRQGRDVVFVLDVSRSMLADDLKPSRLERAKLAIEDCLTILEGDRVGLVVFAGNSVIRCPLTQDYGFFRMMLSDISCDSVSRGGTLIGDALRKVEKEVLDKQDRQFKDIVLITDGEDHESFPLEAAKKIGKEGIRLIAVGLGNDTVGTPIVIAGKYGQKEILKYHGKTVRSRLDSNTLRQMVSATPGGRYLPVGTGNIDLGHIYQELIAKADRHEIASQTIQRYEEKFQIFLLASMIFLALSLVLNDRRKISASAALLLALLSAGSILQAAPSEFKEGNRFFNDQKYDQALKNYKDASIQNPESPYLHYNLGLTEYRLKNYARAEKEFKEAQKKALDCQLNDDNLKIKIRRGLADTYFRQAQRQTDSNLRKTIEAYQKSASELSGLLAEHPNQETARKNLKNIRLIVKKLNNDLVRQMKQQQKAMQQAQQQSQKLDQLSKQQKQAAARSGQAGKQQDQSDRTQQQLSDRQKQLNQDTRQLQQERRQQQQQNQKADKKLQDALEKQEKAADALKQKNYQEAEKQQKAAGDDLQKAKEEIDKELKQKQQQAEAEKQAEEQKKQQKQEAGKDNQKQQEAGKQQDKQQSQSGQQQSEQAQSDKEESYNLNESSQDILDEERRNQRERGRHQKMQQRPVDKDW